MSEESGFSLIFQTYVVPVLILIVGIIIGFFGRILERFYEEWRDREVQKRVSRGDLKMSLKNFCDQWEDRDCLIPHTDLRKDLIEVIKEIRERLNDESAKLSEKEKMNIRKVTIDFLKLADVQNIDDLTWSKKVETEMNKICTALKKAMEELV